MASSRYVIVGGGMTADAAVRGIRELDVNGPITILAGEPDPPYSRPPLSKALWKGDPYQSVWRGTGEVQGVAIHLGRMAKSVDVAAGEVIDDLGTVHQYGKLLLATGATPRRLPFGGDDVIYFRTLADYRRLRALATTGTTFAVIGGGFIGSEVAAALTMQQCRVTLCFPEEGIGSRVFPPDLSRFLVDYYREKGVTVRPGSKVTDLRQSETSFTLDLGENKVTAAAVVAGVGVTPNTDLAQSIGAVCDDGIVVDENLMTSIPDIFAAGDAARIFSPVLGKPIRVEHEDNALSMGKAAGRAMAGDTARYVHLPFFYSDLFDLGYEAVGDTDPRHEVVADWKEKFREGVVYYLSRGRVRGVLLWNTWGQVDQARALIAEPGPITANELKGRLPRL